MTKIGVTPPRLEPSDWEPQRRVHTFSARPSLFLSVCLCGATCLLPAVSLSLSLTKATSPFA
ncbi:hypothetical protein BO86DRAFT_214620 [Aspergillus japonicus CBS 114.51]|uniref:Uncharacterized protein n=1 Tax=Aspergillus japonicus CBS 114.51 TaxID=1448312 RepID=A0A8T8WPS2_ASPJA|nr:hypothetical protein BO86DRAFT_214620 [Aspergillus japonicus CBS 114.51]RAH77640.1 hypothetical protein BO86DRAFT_214620 [Aspergillus japonicus CBS 114.51]